MQRKGHLESTAAQRDTESVEQSADRRTDSADRRTILAGDRTLLAAERTYAAWVRTALAALAAGVGARALMRNAVPDWLPKITGSVLVIFSGFCLVAAVWRDLHGTSPPPMPDVRRIPIGLLVPMNGLLLLVAIAALVGIWAA